MSHKTIVAIFEDFEPHHLYKDVGMIPVYLAEQHGWDARLLCFDRPSNRTIPESSLRGAHIIRVTAMLRNIPRFLPLARNARMFVYLFRHARAIDVLMLFHLKEASYWYAKFYRFLNPQGRIYLKLDLGARFYEDIRAMHEGWDPLAKRFPGTLQRIKETARKLVLLPLYRSLLKMSDHISIETRALYEQISGDFLGVPLKDKVHYIPNGIDDVLIEREDQLNNTSDKKENIILSVGTVGDANKNHVMLLDAIRGLDLKGWRVVLVGPILPAMRKIIGHDLQLKNKVDIIGPVWDKKLVYGYYLKAKAFVMPSIEESFGIVLSEALYFGNYIISTPTGAAMDIVGKDICGTILEAGNRPSALKDVLLSLVQGHIDLERARAQGIVKSKQTFVWSVIAKDINEMLGNNDYGK